MEYRFMILLMTLGLLTIEEYILWLQLLIYLTLPQVMFENMATVIDFIMMRQYQHILPQHGLIAVLPVTGIGIIVILSHQVIGSLKIPEITWPENMITGRAKNDTGPTF